MHIKHTTSIFCLYCIYAVTKKGASIFLSVTMQLLTDFQNFSLTDVPVN